jgi:hypothetical protein
MRYILHDIPVHISKDLDSDIFPYICHLGFWFSSVRRNKSWDRGDTFLRNVGLQ